MATQRSALLLVLIALLSILPALAEASPPDQAWLAGLYDDADYDDVVRFLTSADGVVEPNTPRGSELARPAIAALFQTDETLPRLDRSSGATRAPPVA
jgi:hypothetical protein